LQERKATEQLLARLYLAVSDLEREACHEPLGQQGY